MEQEVLAAKPEWVQADAQRQAAELALANLKAKQEAAAAADPQMATAQKTYDDALAQIAALQAAAEAAEAKQRAARPVAEKAHADVAKIQQAKLQLEAQRSGYQNQVQTLRNMLSGQ